jgi:ubiquitin-conjugating enzyme (huntingtin interacting protein 2)
LDFVFDYPRAAAMTIRTVLLSLQALLATPEPDDPQDAGK